MVSGSYLIGKDKHVVPEPATMGLLSLLALSLPKRGGLGLIIRRKK
jgi:hypothetical protein